MDWKLKATRSFAPVAAIIIWWARPLIWKSCNNILDLKPLTKEKKEKEKEKSVVMWDLQKLTLENLFVCLLACPLAVLSYVWIMTRVARLQTHILPLSLSLSLVSCNPVIMWVLSAWWYADKPFLRRLSLYQQQAKPMCMWPNNIIIVMSFWFRFHPKRHRPPRNILSAA